MSDEIRVNVLMLACCSVQLKIKKMQHNGKMHGLMLTPVILRQIEIRKMRSRFDVSNIEKCFAQTSNCQALGKRRRRSRSEEKQCSRKEIRTLNKRSVAYFHVAV